MTSYQCEECGANFSKLSQLLQHRRTENHWKKYICSRCRKVFNRKDNLDRHMRKHQNENNHHCQTCSKVFTTVGALENHLLQHTNQVGGAVKRPSENSEREDYKKKRMELLGTPEKFYDIEKVSERKIEKINTTASYYKISVKGLEVKGLPEILKTFKKLFQSILDHIVGNIPSQDLVGISMDNPELDYPIVLLFMRQNALTVDRLLSEIERVLQSYEEFVIDETFGI